MGVPRVARGMMACRERVPDLMMAYNGDVKRVAEHLGRGVRFVRRWAIRFQDGEGFHNAPGAGRKRLLNGAATATAKRMATSDTKTYATTIARKLHEHGHTKIQVSSSTIARAIGKGRAPLKYMALIRRQHLTELNKQNGLDWAQKHLGVDWENVMVTDSHYCVQGRSSGRKRWQNPKKRAIVDVKAHGMHAHVYAGATVHGVTRLQFVTGTTCIKSNTMGAKGVNNTEYCEVIRNTLVTEGEKMFPFSVYQDGASSHTSAETKRLRASYNNIQALQSAPKSPDLNWIENLWEELDDKLMGKTFKSIRTYKAAITKAWSEITKELCQKHVKSMPGRLRKVIEQGGGHIERNIY